MSNLKTHNDRGLLKHFKSIFKHFNTVITSEFPYIHY